MRLTARRRKVLRRYRRGGARAAWSIGAAPGDRIRTGDAGEIKRLALYGGVCLAPEGHGDEHAAAGVANAHARYIMAGN